MISASVSMLTDELAKLPGIGKKSAERLTYHLLRVTRDEALALADAIRAVKDNVRYCEDCYNLAEGPKCAVCEDPARDGSLLCIVEQPRDLMALEQSGTYRGLYHVLPGRIAPLENVGPGDLTIEALVELVRQQVGVTVVPLLQRARWRDDEALRVLPLEAGGEPVWRTIGMLERRDHSRRHITEAIRAACAALFCEPR